MLPVTGMRHPIVALKNAQAEAKQCVDTLESNLNKCWVCDDKKDDKDDKDDDDKDDDTPPNFNLSRCCTRHFLCSGHGSKELATRPEIKRNDVVVLKCCAPNCKADAIWPLEQLTPSANKQNSNVYYAIRAVKASLEAGEKCEHASNVERAAQSNRADHRVAAAATAQYEAEAKVNERDTSIREKDAKIALLEAQAAVAAAAATAAATAPRPARRTGAPRKADFTTEEWEARVAHTKELKRKRDEKKTAVAGDAFLLRNVVPKCQDLMGPAPYAVFIAGRHAEEEAAAAEAAAAAAATAAAAHRARHMLIDDDDDAEVHAAEEEEDDFMDAA